MKIVLQVHVFTSLLVTTLILALLFILNRALKKYNSYDRPNTLVFIALSLVKYFDSSVESFISKKYVKIMGPYMAALASYILFSNYLGLFALESPTSNFSCTLALAFISWIIFQYTDIKYSGIKSYIISLFQPIFLFFIPNVLSLISPLVSMSLRLFGNIMSGSVLTSLLYNFTSMISNTIFPFLNGFDIIGIFVAAPIRAFFDIFSGFIQMYIFITLTLVFTGIKIPESEAKLDQTT